MAEKSTQTDDSGVLELTGAHLLLKKLIAAANQNALREKNGYRYDDDVKSFASYFRMLSGPLAYETIHRNLESALPSLSAVDKYVASKTFNKKMIEGVLRCDGWLFYLNQRKLPLLVSLSEDTTRIDGRIQYDSKTNMIVGFVLPINRSNGMPEPYTYKARNETEIIEHFSSNNSVAK